jgi:hypothetical protein
MRTYGFWCVGNPETGDKTSFALSQWFDYIEERTPKIGMRREGIFGFLSANGLQVRNDQSRAWGFVVITGAAVVVGLHWMSRRPLHKSLHTNKPIEPNEPNRCRQPPP